MALARNVESLGYSTLTMPDHFDDQLAPVPALMAAAAATETLRVGALVWDNDYRHPVVLAKELATIDVLSGGRLEIGLGAGWLATDYQQSGIPYDSNKVRVDRFEEGLAVIKAALSGEAFSFDGSHYTITDFTGHTATGAVTVPADLGRWWRQARVVDCRTPGRHRRHQRHPVRRRCRARSHRNDDRRGRRSEGRDRPAPQPVHRLADLEFNIRAFLVRVTDDRDAAVEQIAGFVQVDPSMVIESPFVLIGTPAQIVEDLLRRRERWGFSYVIVGADDVEPFAPVVAELAGH